MKFETVIYFLLATFAAANLHRRGTADGILRKSMTTNNTSPIDSSLQDLFFCDVAAEQSAQSPLLNQWKCSQSKPIIPVCQWSGVTCNECGTVTQINLFQSKLVGTIPSSIGYLTDLFSINFIGNSLQGGIPSQIGLLQKLVFLGLGENKLSGSIPPSVGNLSNVNVFYVGDNSLSGAVPSDVCRRSNMAYLDITHNSPSLCYPSCVTRISRSHYDGVMECGE